MELLVTLIVGGIAGWLAGNFMNAEGGIIRNVILGLIGGFVGGILFGLLGLSSTGIIGQIIIATVGAAVVIWGVRQIS